MTKSLLLQDTRCYCELVTNSTWFQFGLGQLSNVLWKPLSINSGHNNISLHGVYLSSSINVRIQGWWKVTDPQ